MSVIKASSNLALGSMKYNSETDSTWYVYGEFFGFERDGKFYRKGKEYSEEEFYHKITTT